MNAAPLDAAGETKIAPAERQNHLTCRPSAETHRDVDERPYADLADPDCADWT
ncbi:MAG TPA: hypothetical protein VGS02_08385 [Acidobacteriaceae bacterium]|nr:hypothetical protein [Acidobacteriaceae bacterium]